MTHHKISSIEPLKKEWIDYVYSLTGIEIQLIDRDTCLKDKKVFQSVEILICRDRDPINEIIDVCDSLRFLFIVSVGVEKLPFQKLLQKNISVANTKGISSDIMSNYVIGSMLSWSCKFTQSFKNQLNKYWQPYQTIDSLRGKRLLIVGAGKTGQEIARKAKVFEMDCVGVKKYPTKMLNFAEVISLGDIDSVIGEADYIVCTIPITDETKQMFNINMFKQMKSSAIFINISRGSLIVQEDLSYALSNGLIRGAVLDVFEKEPLQADSELWGLDNLMITPHSSGRLEDYMFHAMEIFSGNFNLYTSEGKLLTPVNLNDCY